jgi:hypothetical protein
MKSFVVFVLWLLVWLVVWWKLGYDYILTQLNGNVSSIVDTLMTNGVGSGSQQIVQQVQGQTTQVVAEQKWLLKEEMKKQLTDYLNKKIDESF